ncbi:MAG: 1-phosphofructokinase [Bacilli bacterium]
MIYTLTFSPSLDYYLDVPAFKDGAINRSVKEKYVAGGKGINVSLVLKELNYKSITLGFIAGFTGKELTRRLSTKGIPTDFVETKGNTRINVKINSDRESAINANGPDISKKEIDELFKKLDNIKGGDILAIGGNIPNSLPKDMYLRIMEFLDGRNIKIIVDATGELLLSTLRYHPFLIKPNQEELEELVKRKLNSSEEIIDAAKQLIEMGARNIIISRGGHGAIMIDENGNIYNKPATTGKMKSTVGAGDSLVGGFIAGYLKYGNYEDALELGIAAGSATAFSNYISSKNKILEIYNHIRKRKE